MAAVDDPESAAERRGRITADLMEKTGIDDAMIERLVRAFYMRVQADPLLGPVFATRVHDWEVHIAKLCAFWSSVALMSGRYHGNPLAPHLKLPLEPPHFARWLALFERTARDLCSEAGAALLLEKARRIAQSLQLGVEAKHGVLPARQRTA